MKKKGDRFQPHPRGMFATPADEKRSPCPRRIYIEIELLILAGATDCADPTCQFYGFNELPTPKMYRRYFLRGGAQRRSSRLLARRQNYFEKAGAHRANVSISAARARVRKSA